MRRAELLARGGDQDFARRADRNYRGYQNKICAESRTKYVAESAMQWKVSDAGIPEESTSENPFYLL